MGDFGVRGRGFRPIFTGFVPYLLIRKDLEGRDGPGVAFGLQEIEHFDGLVGGALGIVDVTATEVEGVVPGGLLKGEG